MDSIQHFFRGLVPRQPGARANNNDDNHTNTDDGGVQHGVSERGVGESETTSRESQMPSNDIEVDISMSMSMDDGHESDAGMPALQDVSDSSDDESFVDSDDDRASSMDEDDDNNATNTNNNEFADMPPLEPITLPQPQPQSQPRRNRRVRVEDDHDEERDRRHPSQRASTPNPNTNPNPIPPPRALPRTNFFRTFVTPPNDNAPNAQGNANANPGNPFGGGRWHGHALPGGGIAFHFGGPFPGGNTPGGFGLPFGDLMAHLGAALNGEPEVQDPERAKKLVDALEEVPIGLVRRLERVGDVGGGETDTGGSGGDSGCAICWDRLLDGDGEQFGKEKELESHDDTPKIVSLPCAHVFHASCLIPWFSRPKQTTCPTCRFNIDPENLTYTRRRPAPRTQAGENRNTTEAGVGTDPEPAAAAPAQAEAEPQTPPAGAGGLDDFIRDTLERIDAVMNPLPFPTIPTQEERAAEPQSAAPQPTTAPEAGEPQPAPAPAPQPSPAQILADIGERMARNLRNVNDNTNANANANDNDPRPDGLTNIGATLQRLLAGGVQMQTRIVNVPLTARGNPLASNAAPGTGPLPRFNMPAFTFGQTLRMNAPRMNPNPNPNPNPTVPNPAAEEDSEILSFGFDVFIDGPMGRDDLDLGLGEEGDVDMEMAMGGLFGDEPQPQPQHEHPEQGDAEDGETTVPPNPNPNRNAGGRPRPRNIFEGAFERVFAATGTAPFSESFVPPSRREKKKWALPPPPGPTLRQRIEKKEREAGLRCFDTSCGVGPSDEEPFVELTEVAKKQVHIQGNVCTHMFHPSCLVSAQRVALQGTEEVVKDGEVEVSCPVCKADGIVSKELWDEGVSAMA